MGISVTTLLVHEIAPLSAKQQTVTGYCAYKIVLKAMGYDPGKQELSAAMLIYFDAQIAKLKKLVAGQEDTPTAIKALVDEGEIESDVTVKSTTTLLVPEPLRQEMNLPQHYVADTLIGDLIRKGCKLHSINDQPANRVVAFDFLKREVREVLEFCDMGPLCRDPNLGPALIYMINGVYVSWAPLCRNEEGKIRKAPLGDAAVKRLEEAIAGQKAKQGIRPLMTNTANTLETAQLAADLLRRLSTGRILS
ncbi:MAG: hypothetical protein EYC62_07090 [Alphaproteobacteria bacterium]|nr:MAG: hypothetical protein EYC62_07090 [Alphaproteobacteria bacterium]